LCAKAGEHSTADRAKAVRWMRPLRAATAKVLWRRA
jgi:hypothetical protein